LFVAHPAAAIVTRVVDGSHAAFQLRAGTRLRRTARIWVTMSL
jgi:hypothetical protein